MSLMLFAQKGGGGDGGAAAAGGMMIAMMCCYGVILVAALAWQIFVLITMYKALNAVSPGNRDMEPAMIFLIFIPFFGFVWYFFIVIRMASSLRKEFADRGLKEDGDFGQLFGILAPLIPCVGLILMIMWVMKIRGYTAQLTGGGKRKSRDDDDE